MLGGTDVNIFGGGTIDGQGQIWWDLIPLTNDTVQRPVLFNVDGLIGGTISNLHLMNPPDWFNIVQNSQDVVYDNLNLTAISNGTYPAANSDGWGKSGLISEISTDSNLKRHLPIIEHCHSEYQRQQRR